MAETKHIPVPKDTLAVICGKCGAVALDPSNICMPQGRGKKTDWCGIKGHKPPSSCKNAVNTARWQCKKCSQTSVNPELLCEPEKIES